MIKKDSNVDSCLNQHQRKVSALEHLDSEEDKEEKKDFYHKVGVNKVDSEYEQQIDKNSAFSESMKMGEKSNSNVIQSNRSIEEEDFLDVQFMEKSLDLKYKSGFKKSKPEKVEQK